MKKTLLITAATAVLLGVGLGIYSLAFTNTRPPDDVGVPESTDTNADEAFDASPATDEDNEEINSKKLQNDSKPSSDTNESFSENVKPVITYAEDRGDSIAIGSFVNAGSKGTCLLTVSKGNKTVSEQTAAEFNVNKYDCSFKIAQSKFNESGTWSAEVKFEASSESGTSEKYNFEVNK